jgi:DNA repair protein RecO (recombination protein O)
MTSPVIVKTNAIVLRISPLSRTSHVTTWMTPDHGRVTTVVKGACRPNSAFLGQYDLFTTCELLFYRRDSEGLHAIRECTPLDSRESLRADWRRVCTASYLCDLTSRACPAGQESGPIYRLLAGALDALCAGPADTEGVLRYELSLLHALGLMPQLAPCPRCHTPEQPWTRFALASGRVVCPHTGAGTPGEPTVTVHREALDILLRFAESTEPSCPDPRPSSPRDSTPPVAGPRRFGESAPHLSLGSRRFLGIFMRFHLDLPSAPRRLAFELLETDPASMGRAKGERP